MIFEGHKAIQSDQAEHGVMRGRWSRLSGRLRLRFDPETEAEFQDATEKDRRASLIFIGACLAVFCLAAIPLDFLEHVDPWRAAAIRLGLLLPIQLVSLYALHTTRSDWAQAVSTVAPLTAAVLVVALLGYLTEAARPQVAERYYLAAGAIAFTFNLLAPLKIRHAVLATITVLAVYNTHIYVFSSAHMQPTAAFVTVVALFSLFIRHKLERAERADFLSQRAMARLNRELLDLTEQLGQQASTDPLTGLANRRKLQEALNENWQRAARAQSWIGAAVADIDHFKHFNDAGGHLEGDECLKTIAARLDAVARRAGGTIARFGGEEFAIVVAGTDPDAILKLGEALRQEINRAAIPHPGLGAGCNVTISVGVSSTVPASLLDSADVLRAADSALYEAKRRGRDMVVGRETSARRPGACSHTDAAPHRVDGPDGAPRPPFTFEHAAPVPEHARRRSRSE